MNSGSLPPIPGGLATLPAGLDELVSVDGELKQVDQLLNDGLKVALLDASQATEHVERLTGSHLIYEGVELWAVPHVSVNLCQVPRASSDL